MLFHYYLLMSNIRVRLNQAPKNVIFRRRTSYEKPFITTIQSPRVRFMKEQIEISSKIRMETKAIEAKKLKAGFRPNIMEKCEKLVKNGQALLQAYKKKEETASSVIGMESNYLSSSSICSGEKSRRYSSCINEEIKSSGSSKKRILSRKESRNNIQRSMRQLDLDLKHGRINQEIYEISTKIESMNGVLNTMLPSVVFNSFKNWKSKEIYSPSRATILDYYLKKKIEKAINRVDKDMTLLNEEVKEENLNCVLENLKKHIKSKENNNRRSGSQEKIRLPWLREIHDVCERKKKGKLKSKKKLLVASLGPLVQYTHLNTKSP